MAKDKNNSPDNDWKYIPVDDPSQTWTSFDLGVSAALICCGFQLLSLDKNNPRKALFVFQKQDGLEEVVDGYWSDRLEVKALAFFNAIKMLKNRLYSSD